MYDVLIVTHLPAFYKVNLYNEISKYNKVMVIFVACQSVQRTADFVGNDFEFDHVFLNDGCLERRSLIKSALKLYALMSSISFNRLLVSGWDLPEYWFLVFLNKKNINNLALESTVRESQSSGFKRLLKKFFLSRVGRVLASGSLHKELLVSLGYKGDIRITQGVGLINKPTSVFHRAIRDHYRHRFLFLGRLSDEKNLILLLQVFNSIPYCSLTLVGNGPQKSYLSEVKPGNVEIKEHIDNKDLGLLFSDYDFLILPSLSETWGLVIEEALYFNVPVIVSSYCGGAELIENGVNGYVVEPTFESMHGLISSISQEQYQSLSNDIHSFLSNKDLAQINSYKNL